MSKDKPKTSRISGQVTFNHITGKAVGKAGREIQFLRAFLIMEYMTTKEFSPGDSTRNELIIRHAIEYADNCLKSPDYVKKIKKGLYL